MHAGNVAAVISQRSKGNRVTTNVQQRPFKVIRFKDNRFGDFDTVLVVAKVESITSYAMRIRGVNAKVIWSRISVQSKGTQDCFAMNVKHCTCIFKQKADVFQRIVHLQKPQDCMDIVEKGATVTSESEESFQWAGWGEILAG